MCRTKRQSYPATNPRQPPLRLHHLDSRALTKWLLSFWFKLSYSVSGSPEPHAESTGCCSRKRGEEPERDDEQRTIGHTETPLQTQVLLDEGVMAKAAGHHRRPSPPPPSLACQQTAMRMKRYKSLKSGDHVTLMKFLKPAIYEVEDDARGSRSKWRTATQAIPPRSLLINKASSYARSFSLSLSLSLSLVTLLPCLVNPGKRTREGKQSRASEVAEVEP